MNTTDRIADVDALLAQGARPLPVIFLDVDGVLNCDTTKERCQGLRGVEPVMCQRLNRILDKTGAVIVLSSTWRKHAEMLPYLWTNLGLLANRRCISETPVLGYWMPDGETQRACHRGDEIQAWIDCHPAATNFVILDDDDRVGPKLVSRLVLTSADCGLTDADADKVIAMLNGATKGTP